MNQSVVKALMLLDLFTEEQPELSLKELTEKSQLPKPTVFRLLRTLEHCGFVLKSKESQHDARYKLGLKLLELGNLVSEQLEIREIALPQMKKLAGEMNEAVHLVIENNLEAVYIEKVESKRALRLYTKIGKRSPLYLGSGPKLLLAFLPKATQTKVLQAGKKEKLMEELGQIRKNGFAISYGEQDTETTGVSYPIYDYHHQVVAALAVSGASSRFKGTDLENIKKQTKACAAAISAELGYKQSI